MNHESAQSAGQAREVAETRLADVQRLVEQQEAGQLAELMQQRDSWQRRAETACRAVGRSVRDIQKRCNGRARGPSGARSGHGGSGVRGNRSRPGRNQSRPVDAAAEGAGNFGPRHAAGSGRSFGPCRRALGYRARSACQRLRTTAGTDGWSSGGVTGGPASIESKYATGSDASSKVGSPGHRHKAPSCRQEAHIAQRILKSVCSLAGCWLRESRRREHYCDKGSKLPQQVTSLNQISKWRELLRLVTNPKCLTMTTAVP